MTTPEEFQRSEREFFDLTLDFQGQNVQRSDTPETMVTEYPHRPAPDISLPCEKCKTYIPLIQIKEHRAFHSALSVLKYTTEEPKNSDVLLKRRNLVLRRMKAASTKEKPVTPQQINEVNDAYEYIKAILDGNFESHRQVREDVNVHVGGVALNCSPDCVQAVGMAASSNERWKSYMEDTRSFQDFFGDDKHKCFVGLYDGYHGRFAAEVAASELYKLVMSEMSKFDPRTKMVIGTNPLGDPDLSHYKFERPDTMHSERVLLYDESVGIIQNIINLCEDKYNKLIKRTDSVKDNQDDDEDIAEESNTARKKKKQKTPFEQKMESAFAKAYYYLDILLSYGKDENSKIRWSGCSATTCVIQDLLPEEREKMDQSKDDKDNDSVVSGQYDPPKQIGTIYLANAGNVHGVLVRGNRAYTLTKDHTPSNRKERARVVKEGGTLSESTKECQVNGVLLTTRGLGNHGDKNLKKCVIVEPHTISAPIDQYAQFIILATRGVWEVFTEKEAASLLTKLLPCNQIPPPSKVNSTLRPLLDEMNRPISQDSRKVSFSSRGSPSLRKSADVVQNGRQRSGTLHSVAESLLEDGSNKSGQGSIEGQKSSDGKGQGNDSKSSCDNKKEDEVKGQTSGSGTEVNDKSSRSPSGKNGEGEGQTSDVTISSPDKKSSQEDSPTRNQSTPTNRTTSNRLSRRYVDADMQTEVGSRHGDAGSDDDSGNEADIDSYLENVSFPGGISRISMVDGPPSKEQMQRNLAQTMAQHLVQAALLAGAKDNTSVMIVLLPGSGL
ncbi:Protein phosphatase 2C-like domain-containing protein 1 [Mactra antiquata]